MIRRYAPLVLASVLIIVVVVVWLLRSDAPSAPRAARAADPSARTPAVDRARPALPQGSAAAAKGDEAPPPVVDKTLHNDGPPKIGGPDQPPPKPLTVDEKLTLARKHLDVMRKHAEMMSQEISTDERAGRSKDAAEKRVRLKRLEAQIELVQGQIKAGIDPSRPEVEQPNTSTAP